MSDTKRMHRPIIASRTRRNQKLRNQISESAHRHYGENSRSASRPRENGLSSNTLTQKIKQVTPLKQRRAEERELRASSANRRETSRNRLGTSLNAQLSNPNELRLRGDSLTNIVPGPTRMQLLEMLRGYSSNNPKSTNPIKEGLLDMRRDIIDAMKDHYRGYRASVDTTYTKTKLNEIQDKYLKLYPIDRKLFELAISFIYQEIYEKIYKGITKTYEKYRDGTMPTDLKKVMQEIDTVFYDANNSGKIVVLKKGEIERKFMEKYPDSFPKIFFSIYYRSLFFSYLSKRTSKNRAFNNNENRILEDQLKLASKAKSAGKLELTEENKQRLSNRRARSMPRL